MQKELVKETMIEEERKQNSVMEISKNILKCSEGFWLHPGSAAML